ncbi:ribosomal protein L35 [Pycnococcus provasolii]
MKGNHNLLRGGSLGPDNYNCSQYIQRRFRSNHKFRDAKGSLFRHPKNQQSFRKPKRIKMTVPKSVRMRFKVTGTGKILRWQTGRSHRRSHKSKNALGRLKRCVPLSKKSKEYKVLVKIGYRSKYRGRYR